MTDKSYVAQEHHVCFICGELFPTGAILLDRRLKKRLDPNQATGYGLCPEHEKLHKDGYVAFVEIDPSRTTNGEPFTIDNTARTGTIIHIKRGVARQIFNPDMKLDLDREMVYCDADLVKRLTALEEESHTHAA